MTEWTITPLKGEEELYRLRWTNKDGSWANYWLEVTKEDIDRLDQVIKQFKT